MDQITFTFDEYESLLEELQRGDYRFQSFRDPITDGTLLLRHDVDFSPRKAVRMAEIEAELGITATYFFLLSAPVYNVFSRQIRERVREIERLGHDVGLHFDSHQYWSDRPDDGALRDRILGERDALSAIAELTDVIAFHNPPEWTLGITFAGFTHTYEPRYFEQIGYVADSNQRWRGEPPLPDGVPDALQLLTHPVLWGDSDRSKDEHLREAYEDAEAQLHRRIDGAMLEETL